MSNPFRCEKKNCVSCTTENFTEDDLQHVLENGVRNGVLKEIYDKKKKELCYVETELGRKLRGGSS